MNTQRFFFLISHQRQRGISLSYTYTKPTLITLELKYLYFIIGLSDELTILNMELTENV